MGTTVPIWRESDREVDGTDQVAHSRVCGCFAGGLGTWIFAPGPRDQIMEIGTSASLFKNVSLVFDFHLT